MGKDLWVAVGLALSCLCISAAKAETLRFPATGDPAFVVDLPDGWTHQLDANGNMLALAADKFAGMSLSIENYSGRLDDLASGIQAGGAQLHNTGAAKVSGYRGFTYDSAGVSPNGAPAHIHMILVKLDDTHAAAATLVSVNGYNAAHYSAAIRALDGIRLTRKGF
jgi:hypothetical protein